MTFLSLFCTDAEREICADRHFGNERIIMCSELRVNEIKCPLNMPTNEVGFIFYIE